MVWTIIINSMSHVKCDFNKNICMFRKYQTIEYASKLCLNKT